ncbi:BACON domain-containing protein [uncultured Acetobacteroides sp.]|uniref:BACON domain-containing protein n=1 Tax=uncultured Acetobacteroides sp. TaxID=1760811 RepID=UPI0029F4D843|nr:BACON domain-containing protein [uncultured Acetobacteroides sp.]
MKLAFFTTKHLDESCHASSIQSTKTNYFRMKKVKMLLLLAVNLLITITSYGQDSEGGSLFTGRSPVSIPIHVLKGKNISVPISLVYSSDGVKVDEHPSWVGMGWNLNAGGIITRMVHKFPDEVLFWRGSFTSPNIWKSEEIMRRSDWASYGLELTGKAADERNEYYKYVAENFDEPDEFFFNFLGYSGHFYINENDGGIVIQSEENFKIKFSSDLQSFDIYDEKGNHFYFEEYESIKAGNASEPSYIPTSWALKNVTSADNFDSFTFNYEIGPFVAQISKQDYAYSGGVDQLVWSNDVQFMRPKYLSSIKYNNRDEIVFSKSKSDEYTYPTSLYRACKIDGAAIDTTFLNSSSAPYWSGKTFPADVYQRILWLKLDRISVKENNRVIKNFDFAYNNSPNERLFLDNLSIKDGAETLLGTYSLSYKSRSSVPRYLEVVGDHWGYNNGMAYGQYANDLEARKVVNEAYLQTGMLQAITYPIGGKTEYEYEINDYSKFVNEQDRTQVSALTGKASGLRIKSIKTFDIGSTNPNSEKQYTYKVNYMQAGDGAPSSGVLNVLPRYLPEESKAGILWGNTFEKLCEPAIPLTLNNNEEYIGYSAVVIKTAENGGATYTTIRYTNHDNGYADIPPDYVLNSQLLRYKTYNSRFFERGNVLNISKYDINKNLVCSEDNTWERLGNPNSSGVRCLYFFREMKDSYNPLLRKLQVHTVSNTGSAYRYLTYPFVLSKKVTTEYYNGSTIPIINSTTYNYYYDSISICLPKRIEKKTSNGDLLSTSFTYPFEITDEPSLGRCIQNYTNLYLDEYLCAMRNMNSANMVGIPVEVINRVTVNGIEKLTSATNYFKMIRYGGTNGYSDEVRIFTPKQKIIDYKPISVSISKDTYSCNCKIVFDSRLRVVSKNTYNADGTLKESIGKDGLLTSMIWNRYKMPIIQATNINTGYLDYLASNSSYNFNDCGDDAKADIITSSIGDMVSSNKLRVNYRTFNSNINGVLESTSDNLGDVTNYRYNNAGDIIYTTNSKGQILNHSAGQVSTGTTSNLFAPAFEVRGCILHFKEGGGSQYIPIIKGNESWNASTNVNWAIVKKMNNGIIITCLANKGLALKGQVTVSSGSDIKTFEITQDCGTIPPAELFFDGKMQACSLDLSSYEGWSLYSSDSWFRNIRKENGMLLFNISQYSTPTNTPLTRVGYIYVRYHDKLSTIKVTQVTDIETDPGDLILE